MIVTFLIPIAVATTVPLQALRGDLSGLQVLGFLAIGLAAFCDRLAGLESRGASNTAAPAAS